MHGSGGAMSKRALSPVMEELTHQETLKHQGMTELACMEVIWLQWTCS